MAQESFYQRTYRRVLKLSFLLVVVFICVFLFLFVKKVKEPTVAFHFMEIFKDAEVESVLFGALDDSLTQEEFKERIPLEEVSESGEYELWKCPLKYAPVLLSDDRTPLEAYLYEDSEQISFRQTDLIKSLNISWDMILDRKINLYALDAKKMINVAQGATQDAEEGKILLCMGGVRQIIELPGGINEFVIRAQAVSSFKDGDVFDPSCDMIVTLDDNDILGKVSVPYGKLSTYSFLETTSPGWHKVDVGFTNDYFDQEKGVDRNLLVKDVQINKLLWAVKGKVRKAIREKYASLCYSLVYFRALDKDRTELIRFFKTRFNIESLRDVITDGYSIKVILREVSIGGLYKQALFAPAPTTISIKLKVPLGGTKLVFCYGVMEEAWGMSGEGVEFIVREYSQPNKPEVILFSNYINPKVNQQDRRWFEGKVDLLRYSGKEVTLIFETKGSAASNIAPILDTAYDYAVWSD